MTGSPGAAAGVASEPELATLLGASLAALDEGIVVADAAGRVVHANAAAARLHGVDGLDATSHAAALRSADGAPYDDDALPLARAARLGEGTEHGRWRLCRPDGSEIAVVGRARPLLDARGTRIGAVLTLREATAAPGRTALAAARAERLQALTAALSLAATPEEVAEAVVANATAVFGAVGTVVALLIDDGQRLRIMRAVDMPSDVEEGWRTFPVDAPAPLAEAAREGRAIFLESRDAWAARYPQLLPMLDATGHQANAVLPLVVHGRVLGVLGAAFDAPHAFDADERALALVVAQQCAQALERARLFAAERSARAEAESANRVKGEFLAAMSHELRTPLNAIAGYVQLLDMGLHGPVTEAQRTALARIELAQRHLLRHVNDVLNFARLQAGRLQYDLAPVALAELLGELEALIAPQLRAKSLGYTVDVPVDCVVRADREKLQQVLLNLLTNAIKFTPAGGRVRVDRARRGDGTGSATTVYLRVSDTGVGIARDKYDAVFEPFVQVDATPAGRAAGSGLGLAISRELARGMGGDLRVRSVVGLGTAFTVALPGAEG